MTDDTVHIACYARVSTEEQNLERQLQGTSDYAARVLDADLSDTETYRDKSTGTNTRRKGYRDLMTAVENGDVEAVIVHSVDRICRSVSDLDATARRLRDADVELHFVSESLVVRPDDDDPFQTALFQLLGVFAEFEAKMIRNRITEGIAARQEADDYHHGPAPLGYAKDNGQLYETERYGEVVGVLESVAKGNLSKRKASKRLGCSRSTIRRALGRPELYSL